MASSRRAEHVPGLATEFRCASYRLVSGDTARRAVAFVIRAYPEKREREALDTLFAREAANAAMALESRAAGKK